VALASFTHSRCVYIVLNVCVIYYLSILYQTIVPNHFVIRYLLQIEQFQNIMFLLENIAVLICNYRRTVSFMSLTIFKHVIIIIVKLSQLLYIYIRKLDVVKQRTCVSSGIGTSLCMYRIFGLDCSLLYHIHVSNALLKYIIQIYMHSTVAWQFTT